MFTVEVGRFEVGWLVFVTHEDGTEEKHGPYTTKLVACGVAGNAFKKYFGVDVLSFLRNW